ncbi:MAG TPA: AAA family ATPase [Thermodesulfobacteriota bacterium]|nr:AAA family ATPase [Thermodesulfobacteriota bacterium]
MLHLEEVRLLTEQYPTRDHYPFNIGVLQQTRRIQFSSPVTFFIGENGSGKTTLLEALARRCQIHIWSGIERTRSIMNPYEERLFLYIEVKWTGGIVPGSFFSSQIFRNFAQLVDEWEADNPGQIDYFGGKSLIAQSHGQSIMSFFKSRYKIKGLYLLDEPETALSPKSQLELLKLLQEMSAQGHAQFIIATHSPILMACPGSVIYSFDDTPAKRVLYEETEHYTLYKDFMANPGRYSKGK